jgi:hypothetical protein
MMIRSVIPGSLIQLGATALKEQMMQEMQKALSGDKK